SPIERNPYSVPNKGDMRALVCECLGEPQDLVLKTLPDPAPGHGQVAIRVPADDGIVHPSGPITPPQARAFASDIKIKSGGANVVVDLVGGEYSEPALRSLA